jgi:hypothetical protein
MRIAENAISNPIQSLAKIAIGDVFILAGTVTKVLYMRIAMPTAENLYNDPGHHKVVDLSTGVICNLVSNHSCITQTNAVIHNAAAK